MSTTQLAPITEAEIDQFVITLSEDHDDLKCQSKHMVHFESGRSDSTGPCSVTVTHRMVSCTKNSLICASRAQQIEMDIQFRPGDCLACGLPLGVCVSVMPV